MRRALALEQRIVPEPNTGCWLWDGWRDRDGYGMVKSAGVDRPAHRVVYEALVGPIPDELQLDHLCRITSCVNPGHLEPVTGRENRRRAWRPRGNVDTETCSRGHDLTHENSYRSPKKPWLRQCRVCITASRERYEERTARRG